MEETGADEGSEGSGKTAGTRRKNGRNGGKGRNGKRNGNVRGRAPGEMDHEIARHPPDGKTRVLLQGGLVTERRVFGQGELKTRLAMSEDPLLAEIADAFNG